MPAAVTRADVLGAQVEQAGDLRVTVVGAEVEVRAHESVRLLQPLEEQLQG